MIRTLLIQGVVVASAVFLAAYLPVLPAIGTWAVFAGFLSVVGAVLIVSQPLSTPTPAGFVGSCVVRYGFRVGKGRLPHAVAVSWLFWLQVGATAITIYHVGQDFWACVLLAAWLVNALALMHISGKALLYRDGGVRIPTSLRKIMTTLALVLGVSVSLAGTQTSWGRTAAIAIAAGPVLTAGAGYGLFVLLMLTLGRKARWN